MHELWNDFIQQGYGYIEKLNISMTALIGISALLALTFLLALREAASWFFKIDDLKRDVRNVHRMTIELETEIKNLHTLIQQASQQIEASPKSFPLTDKDRTTRYL